MSSHQKEIKVHAEGQEISVDQKIFPNLVRVLADHQLEAAVVGGVVVFSGIAAGVVALARHHQEDKKQEAQLLKTRIDFAHPPEGMPKLSPQKQQEFIEKMYNPNYVYIVDILQHMKNSRIPLDVAEDLAQRAFFNIYRRFDHFEPKPGVPDPYRSLAISVAGNLLINYYRDSVHRQHLSLDSYLNPDGESETDDSPYDNLVDPQVGVEDQIVSKEEAAINQLAYSKLASLYQLVIWLESLELENQSIGEILGKTEGAVKSLKFRAHAAVQQKKQEIIAKTHK